MGFVIKEVVSNSDIKKFINFQKHLYKRSKEYVPPLFMDEKESLTSSPSLEYCKLKKWIALDEQGGVVGRIAGIINPHYNEIYGTKRARFNWIDFIEVYEVAALLLKTAEEWALSEGMEEVHGPLAYNTWGKQGMLVSGFENIPPINCIYNFPYYMEYIERYGYEKEVDWIQYKLSAKQLPAEKLYRISEMLLSRYSLKILDLKKAKRDTTLIDDFFKNYNETFKKVHNFIPLTEKEIKKVGRMYIRLLKPELACFVVDETGQIATYGIAFPSFSKAFQRARGRLFPFGWFHIVKAYFKYDTIDLMMVGSDPKWQSKGLSSIYHVKLAENFRKKGVDDAILNPVIEYNTALKVWDSYKDKEDYMVRRTYIRKIK